MYYYVVFTSVDGSGHYDEQFTNESDARAFADAKQEYSNSRGNYWRYQYYVYRTRRVGPVYMTRPTYSRD